MGALEDWTEHERLTAQKRTAQRSLDLATKALDAFNKTHARFHPGDLVEGRVRLRGYHGPSTDDAGYEWRVVRVETYYPTPDRYRVTVRTKVGDWGFTRVSLDPSELRPIEGEL